MALSWAEISRRKRARHPHQNAIECKRYRQRLKQRVVKMFTRDPLYGPCCQRCHAVENLEFAHLRRNEINGEGRGSTRRYLHILKHPEDYILVCRDCHYYIDSEEHPGSALFDVPF